MFGNVFRCFGCILYYKLIFLIIVRDFVSFSVYMNMLTNICLQSSERNGNVEKERERDMNICIYVYIYFFCRV